MTLDSPSCTFSLLSRVTPSTDKATIDTYRDGLSAAGITLPSDVDQIAAREDEVAAGGNTDLQLRDFRDSTASTTPFYDSDGNDVSFDRIDALAVLAVSQTDDNGVEQFRLEAVLNNFIYSTSTYAYGTITPAATAVLGDTLTINTEVWTVAAVTPATRSAYEIPEGALTPTELASYINSDSTGYTAAVDGSDVAVTSTDIYQVGTSTTFSETATSTPTFALDGAGFLTGTGPTSSGIEGATYLLEEVNDFVLQGWTNGIYTDPSTTNATISVTEGLTETAVQFKVVAIGKRSS